MRYITPNIDQNHISETSLLHTTETISLERVQHSQPEETSAHAQIKR